VAQFGEIRTQFWSFGLTKIGPRFVEIRFCSCRACWS